MTLRSTGLPFLPGFNHNTNLGKTKFPLNSKMDTVGGIRMVVDRLDLAKVNTKYPSIYPKGEVAELPGWINYDNKVLTFDCYFQETLQEVPNCPNTVRVCKLYFYLEDGTIKVHEPNVENSGIVHGFFIKRGRISMPPPKDMFHYDIIDFNIGREIELNGRVFKITNCDYFTRNFLNRLGIAVPDPISTPEDPNNRERRIQKERLFSKKPNMDYSDAMIKFLKHDKKVLRFYGYWDDTATEGGYIHDLIIYYYLADDSVQVVEKDTDCHGEKMTMFLKRTRLPKFFDELPTPGYYDKNTVLNVLGDDMINGRYQTDSLNVGHREIQFYGAPDFAIGATIGVYGRKVIITDCDAYTKEVYRTKYGLDNISPIERPKVVHEEMRVALHERKLPPWNGYGSFEDSAQNYVTVELKPLIKDIKPFLKYGREGMESYILRFKAKLKSKIDSKCNRIFVICYYMCDKSICILEQESGTQNSGTFLARTLLKMPYQNDFTSEPPDYYLPQHFFIGATVCLNSYHFVIIDADEYALRYMELHPDEFPRSNIKLILEKLRKKLTSRYKDFVDECLPKGQTVLSYNFLRNKLCEIMCEDWTEQEMITLARHFSAVCNKDKNSRAFIRKVVLTEVRKGLWDDLDRMKEHFRDWDKYRTGYLPRKDVYTLIRACKIPLDKDLIENMLNVYGIRIIPLNKNEKCEIDACDLFQFLDRNFCPTTETIPLNVKRAMWFEEPIATAGRLIDWCAFNKALNLKHLFDEPIVLPKNK